MVSPSVFNHRVQVYSINGTKGVEAAIELIIKHGSLAECNEFNLFWREHAAYVNCSCSLAVPVCAMKDMRPSICLACLLACLLKRNCHWEFHSGPFVLKSKEKARGVFCSRRGSYPHLNTCDCAAQHWWLWSICASCLQSRLRICGVWHRRGWEHCYCTWRCWGESQYWHVKKKWTVRQLSLLIVDANFLTCRDWTTLIA